MGHDNDRRQPRPRRKFSDEFKRDAVELVITTGRPVAEVAVELGIYDSTRGNWVRRHQDEQAAGSG
jgi:transposase